MINNVGPVCHSGKVIRREPAIAFPGQFVDPERETKLACIRWVVWCFVFEVAISIALVLVLVWRLWSA
jgi:hypothetical protein